MLAFVKFCHLAALVVWLGMIVFFSFFAAPSIFKVLPREDAGEVVGDIFPKYWMISYITGIVSVVTLVIISVAAKEFAFARFILLVAMTILSFYSGLVVGKDARRIKGRMKETEDPLEKEKLRRTFKKVHARSSVLNMAVLVLGVLVIYLTALKL